MNARQRAVGIMSALDDTQARYVLGFLVSRIEHDGSVDRNDLAEAIETAAVNSAGEDDCDDPCDEYHED